MRLDIFTLLAAGWLSTLASSFSQHHYARGKSLALGVGTVSSRPTRLCYSAFSNNDDDEEDDDDDAIDVDSLGDWRDFRRNLAGMTSESSAASTNNRKGCAENEQVLRTQNEVLANEYKTGVWAHETSTVRGFVN